MHSSDNGVYAENGRSSKRRRVKTSRYDAEFVDNEEHMYLQQVSALFQPRGPSATI